MDRKKAVAYIRVVTDERTAIDEQKRDIENVAFEKGYDLVEIYADTGSGASLERDGIQKLLRDVRRERVDAVLVYSTDILSTSASNTAELLEALTTLDIRVYSISEKIFINKPLDTLGNLSRKIYNTLSEMEQNGENLRNTMNTDDPSAEKDPSRILQDKIITAYLDLGAEHRTQI